MNALHYVNVDGPADDDTVQMLYYTSHTYTDAPQYVCADVPSEHTYV
jgi:hypothetical protein